MSTTKKEQEREAVEEFARRMLEHAGEQGAPAAVGTAESVWRRVMLALLDDAERVVLGSPRDWSKVQAVREALCAIADGRPCGALDLRDLTFTMGLIATARGLRLLDHGRALQWLRVLSPSAFAEYERGKGFVRVSPRFRC